MSHLPSGETIALVCGLVLAGIVFASMIWAAWLQANDNGDVE